MSMIKGPDTGLIPHDLQPAPETNDQLTQDIADLKQRVASLEHQVALLNKHTHTYEGSGMNGVVNLESIKNYTQGVSGFDGYASMLIAFRDPKNPLPSAYQTSPPNFN
jgi:hypothetical protein